MLEVCDLCKKRIAIFRCNVCKQNICNWCCDKFQMGQETISWRKYAGNYNNFLRKRAKECSVCAYFCRSNEYKVDENSDLEVGLMKFSFEYKDKLIFSFDYKELAKKKIRLVQEEVNKDISDYYILGDSYLSITQYEKAYKYLIKANELVDNDTGNNDKILVYAKTYHCCVGLKLYLQAEKWLNKTIVLDDTMSELYRYKGDIFRLLGDYQKSIMYYEFSFDKLGYGERRELDNFFQFAYIGLAVDYSKLNKYDDTIKWANKFLNGIGSFNYIFEIYQRIKNGMTIDGLGFSFDMIVDLYNLITISYLEKNEFSTAKQYIEESEKLAPENIEVAKLNGRVVQGLNMFDEMDKLKKQLEEALGNRMNNYTFNINGEIKADMINIGDKNINTFKCE